MRPLLLSTTAVSLVAFLSACGAADLNGNGSQTELPDGTKSDSLLPARIRKLTNAEYNATVASLLGTTLKPADDFTPDARQHGYTVNEAQRVDPILARQLDTAAIALAAEAKSKLDTLAPCDDPTAGGAACADEFIRTFGEKAYRRPLLQAEIDGLTGLYQVGSEGAAYADGIEHVIRGLLQSPGFLYHTEIGDSTYGDGKSVVELSQQELAESLSYLITGGPPDAELTKAAAAGDLAKPEERTKHVRRLFVGTLGSARTVQLVREWLGLDRITKTSKDSTIYPEYKDLQAAIGNETETFVREVFSTTKGTVSDLLGADWTVADSKLLTMYGATETGSGRVASPRKGLLNQAAFLSVYAHAHETAPVLRGVTVMRRVGCIDIELPTKLDIVIIPPVPDPLKTTRERFTIHSKDKVCAGCHSMIDPIGFNFEHFDGMGKYREKENNLPVDSSSTTDISLDFDGPHKDSNELAASLADSPAVRECFARQMFRANAAEGIDVDAAEESFIAHWNKLPEDTRGALLETLVALTESSLFTHRRAQ